MSGMVHHVLTETDSFSDVHGAALQRWVANVLRHEESKATVACARADASWDLAHVRALRLRGLWLYSQLKGRYRLPWSIRRPLLRKILRPVVEELKPGCVVWIHNRPDYAVAVASDVREAGASLVLHLHNSLMLSFPREITARLRADQLVFCSRYLEREARSAFPKLGRTTVIHNGADETRFFPRSGSSSETPHQRTPVVLFAGRLVPEKGAHIFIEAMWLLQARGVRVLGRLLGATGFGSRDSSTPYSRGLRRNAPRNVQFGGYCAADTLAEEFRRAEIFCSPSVWEEPFGLVNVEAMASGLPVVTTRGGGVPEIFAAGGALLVGRNSSIELASALEQVLRDPACRHRLGTEGYRSFQKDFTWRAVHGRYRQLLTTLAQN